MATRNAKVSLGRVMALPVLGALLGVASCGDSGSPPPATTTPTTKWTWNDDIGPLVQTHCGSCHYAAGSGHFDLLHYESVKTQSAAALAAMQSGRMPPWPPAADCRQYDGDRSLPTATLDKFQNWVEGGMPIGEGEAKSFDPKQFTKLREDLKANMTEPYTPNASLADDYRCFVLDIDFPADTWIEGVDVTPGTLQVHHVLTYALNGAALASALQADADEAGPGYTCFGGPTPNKPTSVTGVRSFPQLVGAWVPGFQAQAYPPGSAMLVPGTSKLIMQVHYNTASGNPAPDQSSVTMQTRTMPPSYLYRTVPIAQPKLDIKAGDAASAHTMTIANWSSSPVTIASVAGHMHTLGKSITANIQHTSNKEECLLNVPAWDFNWQMQYRLAASSYGMVQPGDRVKLDCIYDNTAENQPVVNGVKQPPQDVTWGEGTLDEMCLMYFGVIDPYTPPAPLPQTACEQAASCIQACSPLDAECMLSCDNVSMECLDCTFNGLISCGALACGIPFQAVKQCVLACAMGVNAFGGAMQDCVTTTCPTEWKAVTQCLNPYFSAPGCEAPLAACGI